MENHSKSGNVSESERESSKKPRYELAQYRQFIRDAAPYVSLVVGRKIRALDADKLKVQELTEIALLIDERVQDLNKNGS
jgi:hypothetical protein